MLPNTRTVQSHQLGGVSKKHTSWLVTTNLSARFHLCRVSGDNLLAVTVVVFRHRDVNHSKHQLTVKPTYMEKLTVGPWASCVMRCMILWENSKQSTKQVSWTGVQRPIVSSREFHNSWGWYSCVLLFVIPSSCNTVDWKQLSHLSQLNAYPSTDLVIGILNSWFVVPMASNDTPSLFEVNYL